LCFALSVLLVSLGVKFAAVERM